MGLRFSFTAPVLIPLAIVTTIPELLTPVYGGQDNAAQNRRRLACDPEAHPPGDAGSDWRMKRAASSRVASATYCP